MLKSKPESRLRDIELAAMIDYSVTYFKSCRCTDCGNKFNVILWDIMDLDSDIFCENPSCYYPVEYELFCI